MQTSIRELKAHLSNYIHQVQEGVELTITLHNRPVAKIIPMPMYQKKLPNRSQLVAELKVLMATLPRHKKPLSHVVLEQRKKERY